MPVDLRVRLGSRELPSPILAASGAAGTGRELARFVDVARIGAVVTKSITVGPRAGHPTPRMVETPSGVLSSVGLQGPGVDAFLSRDLPWLLSRGARTVVSIAGGGVEEYGELAARLSDAAGVTGIEVNLCCSNGEEPGLMFASRPQTAAQVVETVRRHARRDIPVLAKLSAAVTDIVAVARACVAAGADALSLIGGLPGMVLDTDMMRPALAAVSGELSGPAIRPVAVRCVWRVHQVLPDVPIVGVGGVRDGRDALEFVAAGATLVGVGAVVFHDPSACARIQRDLEEELTRRGVTRLGDVVGWAHRGLPSGAPAASPTGGDSVGTVARTILEEAP